MRPAIERGLRFIRRVQREDGSWEGSWGVCSAMAHSLELRRWSPAAGPDDPALQRAAKYLEAHQRRIGSWSETLEANRARRWVEGKTGHAVTTSWALLSLAACGRRDSEAVRRGVRGFGRDRGPDDRCLPSPSPACSTGPAPCITTSTCAPFRSGRWRSQGDIQLDLRARAQHPSMAAAFASDGFGARRAFGGRGPGPCSMACVPSCSAHPGLLSSWSRSPSRRSSRNRSGWRCAPAGCAAPTCTCSTASSPGRRCH